MQIHRLLAAAASLAAFAVAQDQITLANGDTLNGSIKTMADGKVTITTPSLGDVVVPFTQIKNMVTGAQVALQTVSGETFKRRIAGIENASLHLDGDIPAVAIDSLSAINPPPAEPPKWTGTVALNALWADGNTRRRTVGAAAEATRKTDIDRITVDAGWDYAEDRPSGSSNWNLTQRRVGAGLKYDYFISKRWYALATTRVLGDKFADLSLRFTAGLGIGYTVIDEEKTTLTTEAGLSYFNENYISNTPSNDYIAARVAYKLMHVISDKTKLNHGVEAYPSLENSEDIYLQMKTEIVTNLTDNMIASLGWIMDYDNTPAPGRDRADHRVILSVGWSF
ncbi:MAG: DUF481 domain-containing protein [Planctomycetota bacterium]